MVTLPLPHVVASRALPFDPAIEDGGLGMRRAEHSKAVRPTAADPRGARSAVRRVARNTLIPHPNQHVTERAGDRFTAGLSCISKFFSHRNPFLS
jgi:hypothetical protein